MRVDLYSNLAEVEDSHWWLRARRKIVIQTLLFPLIVVERLVRRAVRRTQTLLARKPL